MKSLFCMAISSIEVNQMLNDAFKDPSSGLLTGGVAAAIIYFLVRLIAPWIIESLEVRVDDLKALYALTKKERDALRQEVDELHEANTQLLIQKTELEAKLHASNLLNPHEHD